jgi:hypothetical protein
MECSISPDDAAQAFNADDANRNWSARVSCRNRTSGIINAVSFTYRGGLISIVMDCDCPLGERFTIRFERHTASFGDYLAAIQKGLYRILSSLARAGLASEARGLMSYTQIEFAMRKDGKVTFIRWLPGDGEKSSIADDLL